MADVVMRLGQMRRAAGQRRGAGLAAGPFDEKLAENIKILRRVSRREAIRQLQPRGQIEPVRPGSQVGEAREDFRTVGTEEVKSAAGAAAGQMDGAVKIG